MSHLNPKIAWTIFVVFLAIVFGLVIYYSYAYYRDVSEPTATAVVTTTKPTATPTTTSTVSPTPTATADETADWKTYTNSQYEFSFKYPSTWSVERMTGEIGDDFYLTDNNKKYYYENDIMIPIIVYAAPDTENLGNWNGSIDTYLTRAKIDTKLKQGTTTIDGKTAYIIKGVQSPLYVDQRVIFTNDRLFSISNNEKNILAANPNQAKEGDIVKIFDKILSTFKFTQ